MSDVIHLLPDSVANQIAAGEVVQRPASVVKELMENSIDAGASKIQVKVIDAGKSEIQIVDDGVGMSDTDARLAFERHATSKIKTSHDLFSISTMGFRGEALASVAAVAQIELRTRQQTDELGTCILIEGSKIKSQESISCPVGSNFIIRNLFYNTPARRKFLKSNITELNNIIAEFEKIALCNIEKSLELYHADNLLISLTPSTFKQRIISLFGKKLENYLIPVEAQTSIVRVSGFVTIPEGAKKKKPCQYFYINGRYMRNSYFCKAVQSAYERLITEGEQVQFFLRMEVDPSRIDVNIHPTKTEIKFEDDNAIWQILSASVREALGKYNAIPALDFDKQGCPDIPVVGSSNSIGLPQVHIDESYNPFNTNDHATSDSVHKWQQMYQTLTNNQQAKTASQELNFSEFKDDGGIDIVGEGSTLFQFGKRYVVVLKNDRFVFIEQHRAHYRILYDRYIEQLSQRKGFSQGLLFPELIHFDVVKLSVFNLIREELVVLGFDFSDMGNGTFSINGVPDGTADVSPQLLIENLIGDENLSGRSVGEKIHQVIASHLAMQSAIAIGQVLNQDAMENLVKQLFATTNCKYTPDGKPILHFVELSQINKVFM